MLVTLEEIIRMFRDALANRIIDSPDHRRLDALAQEANDIMDRLIATDEKEEGDA